MSANQLTRLRDALRIRRVCFAEYLACECLACRRNNDAGCALAGPLETANVGVVHAAEDYLQAVDGYLAELDSRGWPPS